MPKQQSPLNTKSHIPFIETIADFFKMYGLGKPLHPEFMCMRLEDQPDEKLLHMPISRVNFYRIILFTNAKLYFYKGHEKVNTVDNCLCFSYPGKIESWTRSDKLYGYVVYFTEAFAGLDSTLHSYDSEYPFFNFYSEQLVPLSPDEAKELSQSDEEMIHEMYSDAPDKLDMLKKLLYVYLHRVRRIYNRKIHSLPSDIKASKNLYNRFRGAIDHYLKMLSHGKKLCYPTVSTMADQLSVSPNYLNGVVKKLTGKTASNHIHERLVLEAKSILIHSQLHAAEVANRLGYQNTSYFNRFFKKASGFSPIEFRKRFGN